MKYSDNVQINNNWKKIKKVEEDQNITNKSNEMKRQKIGKNKYGNNADVILFHKWHLVISAICGKNYIRIVSVFIFS